MSELGIILFQKICEKIDKTCLNFTKYNLKRELGMVVQLAKREINMFSASRRPFHNVELLFNTQEMTITTQTLSSGSGTAKDSPVKNLSLQ